MMKINKKSKEGIKKKIASFSLTALLLNVAMVGVFAPAAEVLAAEAPHITTTKGAVSDECGTAEITLTITGAGDPTEERKPVDVVFVIDRSSSMEGTYLDNVKTAVSNFIDEMNFDSGDLDKVAIVSYAGYSSDPSQINYNLGSDDIAAKSVLNDSANPNFVEAKGGTCIECGLNTAYGMLNAGDREQFVILLSDGVANVNSSNDVCTGVNCPTSATECITNAITQGNDIKNLGVPVYSIGYRLDNISGSGMWQCDNGGITESLARQTLQDISSGTDYYYNGGPDDINEVFNKIAYKINNVAGYDTKIIEVLPVGINYVIGANPREPDDISTDGQTLTWAFGNLAIGESREVVFGVTTDGLLGYGDLIDVYPNTRVEYRDYEDTPYAVPFPETSITIASCSDPETGSITIIKDSVPDGSQSFEFTTTGGLGNFTLIDNDATPLTNSQSFVDIPTGNYTITEAITSGWTLDDIVCTGDDNPTIDKPSRTATVNLDDGENVVCTFINVYEETSCQETILRECVSDGYAKVSYEYYPVGCDDNYTETEENASCVCVETEVAGECVNETHRQFTFTYNYDYCGIEYSENRADKTCGSPTPYCGDGSCNNNETCSTCPQDCGSCGGGGGWTPPTVIKITDEKVTYLGEGKALVSWKTNVTTTNQVVYGDDSIETDGLGDAPKYDYDSVNEESSSMWKEHEVIITGLIDGITYYFRPVADRNGSAEVIGEEVSYVFDEASEEGEVKGVTDLPAPVECNYLLEYIKLGADNNPVEVEKLERFLNEFESENLSINGIYEQIDFDAVSRFQEKYLESVLSPWSHNKATGYVYITTKKKINELYCQRTFPLTAEQEKEVASFSERFLGMFTGSAEASDSSSEDSASGDTSESFETEDEEDVSGRVGGAKDEVDEGDGEDETIEETENGTEDKNETKEEDEKPEDKTGEGADITEDAKDEDKSEVAGIKYSEYLLWLTALVVIAGIAWYYWPKKKEGSE